MAEIEHVEGCVRPDWAHLPPFACTEHGPCCDRPPNLHPLPPLTFGMGRRPEDESPDGHIMPDGAPYRA